MDPIQKLNEQLNAFENKRIDFGSNYISRSKVNSLELIFSASKGALSKKWYKINGVTCLVKGNSLLGAEPYAEVLATNLARILGLKHIPYSLMDADLFKDIEVYGDFKYVSVCEYYSINSNNNRITLHDVLVDKFKDYFLDEREIYQANYVSKILELNSNLLQHLYTLLHFDALIGNKDRHCNNIELEISKETFELKRLLPIFDCGDSFYHYESGDFIRDKAKPLRSTHKEQIDFILDSGYVNNLVKADSSTYVDWEYMSTDIFNLMEYDDACRIKDYFRERIELYGDI